MMVLGTTVGADAVCTTHGGRRHPGPCTEESNIKEPSGRSMTRCVSLGPAGVVLRPRTILTRCASLLGCGLDEATALTVPYGLQTQSEGGYGRLEIVLGQGHGVAPRHPLTFGVSLRYFILVSRTVPGREPDFHDLLQH